MPLYYCDIVILYYLSPFEPFVEYNNITATRRMISGTFYRTAVESDLTMDAWTVVWCGGL